MSTKIYRARSETTFTFRAKTEILIDLKVYDLERTINLFFEKSNLGDSKLQLIPSFQTVDKDLPVFRILVINPTESSIRIPAGTTFVFLHEIVEIARITDKNNKNLDNITVGSIASPKIKNDFFRAC